MLNLCLKDGSSFSGAINPDGAAGDVYVELTDGSKWILTGDSCIKSLTCDVDSIDLNGYTLTVDGKTYTAGSKAEGEAIEIKINESRGDMTPPSGNEPPEKPDGAPPEKPNGEGGPHDGNPPDKPD